MRTMMIPPNTVHLLYWSTSMLPRGLRYSGPPTHLSSRRTRKPRQLQMVRTLVTIFARRHHPTPQEEFWRETTKPVDLHMRDIPLMGQERASFHYPRGWRSMFWMTVMLRTSCDSALPNMLLTVVTDGGTLETLDQ